MSGFRETLQALCDEVAGMLPDISTMSDEQLATILVVYDGVIRPGFVPLLTAAWIACLNGEARAILQDNLLCEVRDDHPSMLKAFVDPVRSRMHPMIARHCTRRGKDWMEMLHNDTTNKGSSVSGLIILAALERTSLVFIPWLEQAAVRLGVTDLTYTQKHGAADMRHAEESARAVEIEMGLHDDSPLLISTFSRDFEYVVEHLRRFFHIFFVEVPYAVTAA